MGISFSNIYTLFVIVFGLVVTCKATVYTVGDSSGWDISTDLDMWQTDKRFIVGDVLSFQYSSSDTVNEVIKDVYDVCNTTNIIQSYSSGNTSITLTQAGDRYFISGNKLYCLGGMKIDAHVNGNQTMSLVGPGTNIPSSDNKNPPSIVPNSAMARGENLIVSFAFVIMGFASVSVLVG